MTTMHFWAKTTDSGEPGVSVYDHMVDVGCVAGALADHVAPVLKRLNLDSSTAAALVALHDLGKISPGFQRKCKGWLEQNKLIAVDRNGRWDASTEADHGKVSHSSIQEFLVEIGVPNSIAKYVAAALGAHHGRLKFYPNDRGIRPPLGIKQIAESASGVDWDRERICYAKQVWKRFGASDLPSSFVGDSAATWWVAGLASVADWIASDVRYFPAEVRTGNLDGNSVARRALEEIGLAAATLQRDLSFEEMFEFPPNDLQRKALAAVTQPGVYVIEAPMGSGKTEAALAVAYHLMVEGRARGIYFALPTQATSNRIHIRLNRFLEHIAPTSAKSRLIHGNSWLLRDDLEYRPSASGPTSRPDDDAQGGRDWFASAKRAMLAPFGVGTVDQALLGVVAAKHFFVRHFALAGKVVILDEIHSYDIYTGTLVDKLVERLEALGCTVIVLSATLTGRRRERIGGGETVSNGAEEPYPLISGRSEGAAFEPIPAIPESSRRIKVDFVSSEDARREAVAVAQGGGPVVWICDTVEAAQREYRQTREILEDEIAVGLLHARFPFSRREELEASWMERLGKNGLGRGGAILISTQVVEQSVDLDADLMITELAPTDMLLQRLGRLWRHHREKRAVAYPRILIIEESRSLEHLRQLGSAEIKETLGNKALVYSPYVLLRSLQVWKKRSEMIVPDDIRALLDATYESADADPKSWQELFKDDYGQSLAYRQAALSSANIWQPPLHDREGVQTRINELETVSLILCRSISGRDVVFVDGTSAVLGTGSFLFATAKAIHRNLVKVARYHFERIAPSKEFDQYVHETHCVGIVDSGGGVDVEGLKPEIAMSYTDELGLFVDQLSNRGRDEYRL